MPATEGRGGGPDSNLQFPALDAYVLSLEPRDFSIEKAPHHRTVLLGAGLGRGSGGWVGDH